MKKVVRGKLDGKGKLLGLDKTRRLKMGHFVLKPGESVPVHVTCEREEVIVVLSGKMKLSMGKRDVLVEGGEWIYVKPELEHGVENAGKDDLEYVYVVAMF